jgi:hypothetical protein
MIWFLRDWDRLGRERAAIEELQEKAPWLKGIAWGIDGSALSLDADLEAHGYIYAVRMTYPATFPANPPAVRPRAEHGAALWSTHQYGLGGELCLEWGPDTWMPEVTGAQMLESAHVLLDVENPQGAALGERSLVAPSRHALTAGQEMRGAVYRFLATAALRERLDALLPGAHGEVDALGLIWQHESITALVAALRPDGAEPWTHPGLPSRLETYSIRWLGLFAKTELPPERLLVGTVDELRGAFAGDAAFSARLEAALKEPVVFGLLLAQDNAAGLHLFRLPTGTTELLRFRALNLPRQHQWERLGPDVNGLSAKRVGIVGLGSVGSKVALTLARSGVSRFVLVDDDLFLPENLVRHTLDWRSVGEQKVVAVEDQLALISSSIDVDVRRVRLTGQESTASVAGALQALAGCDLIVDATAHPSTFNQLAMVATQYRRALVWLEVYAGGIGGMVARHRPGKDAPPHTMRERYHAFTVATEAPTANPPAPYASAPDSPEAAIMVASDADVAVIAHHAARLALDALAEREPSLFPYSMYLIGLARGWHFDQPFQTIPIDTGPPPSSTLPEPPSKAIAEGVRFVTGLLEIEAVGRVASG